MVFMKDFYGFLLLAHLFATFVLVGAMTHNLLIVFDYLRGRFGRQNLEWLYVRVSLWTYLIVYVIGALIYPAYRVHISHEYFDPQLPWATGLFEVKEHWGAVGLAMFLAYYSLGENLRPALEIENCKLTIENRLLEHTWKWVKEQGVPSQGWYGMQAFASLAAGIVSLCVYFASSVLHWPRQRSSLP